MFTYETIVVGTDFSEAGSAGVRAAAALAEQVSAKRLHIVHVATYPYHQAVVIVPEAPPDALSDELVRSILSECEGRMERIELPKTNVRVTRECRFGVPARELSCAAADIDADLVVVATRGMGGITRFFVGSLSSALLRTAHCPVLVLREGATPGHRFANVLAAVDASRVSAVVLENALAMTAPASAVPNVLAVYEEPALTASISTNKPAEVLTDAQQAYRAVIDALVEEAGGSAMEVDFVIEDHRSVSRIIADRVDEEGYDLLVLGSSGGGGWHRMLLGSTANRALIEVPCAVLVVPHDSADLPQTPPRPPRRTM